MVSTRDMQGNMEQAKQDLEAARSMRDHGQVNVAPVLALANMALHAGNIDEALARYAASALFPFRHVTAAQTASDHRVTA